jgi:hypothetical protein
VEIAIFTLGIFLEKMRPDLAVRRWWSRLGLRPLIGLRVPVPVALAGVEARRLALRASTLLVLYVLYRVLSGPYPGKVYDGVNHLVGFSLALLGLAAMAILASIGGRDRGVEIIEALPAHGRLRVSSWFVLLGIAALLEYAALLYRRYHDTAPDYEALLPDAWGLVQGPAMLIGGGLLGLLAARRLPAWVAAPVTVVASVMWVGTLSGGSWPNTPMLAPLIELVQYREDERIVIEPGSFAWHNGYLLGLCAMGVVAVLLCEGGRRRTLLAVGGVLAVATPVAGALALP